MKQKNDDFPVGWLQEEFDAMEVDIENMSEKEKANLQNNVANLRKFLDKMKEDND